METIIKQGLINESRDSPRITGVITGFTEFDRITGGLKPGDLILLGSRPAMGKTSFMLNIAWHTCVEKDIPTAIFSLEMEKKQLNLRLLRAENGNDEHQEDAQRTLDNAPLFVYDSPGTTITEVKEICRRLKSEQNLGLVFIDYLQLMPGRDFTYVDRRAIEVAHIMQMLAECAKEINVPIVVATQLNRKVEARKNRRPKLCDICHLSDGINIDDAYEADADVVAFLYRDKYYNPETQKKNHAEVIIAKNRHGATGTIALAFHGDIGKFANILENNLEELY